MQAVLDRLQHRGPFQRTRLFERRMEAAPEPLQHPPPGERAASDAVEVFLHRRREAGLYPTAEERLQERGRDPAPFGGHEAPVVQDRVVAFLQHGDDRRPGRRPADAELVQPAHQPRLRVARRRLRDVALDPHRNRRHGLPFRQRGEHGPVPFGVPTAVTAPDPQMAVEDHLRAPGRQHDAACFRPFRGDLHPYPVEPGRRHLARQRAVPDKPVELHRRAAQTAFQLVRRAAEVGRPDRLVRLLGMALPGPERARLRRHAIAAVGPSDDRAGLRHRRLL